MHPQRKLLLERWLLCGRALLLPRVIRSAATQQGRQRPHLAVPVQQVAKQDRNTQDIDHHAQSAYWEHCRVLVPGREVIAFHAGLGCQIVLS